MDDNDVSWKRRALNAESTSRDVAAWATSNINILNGQIDGLRHDLSAVAGDLVYERKRFRKLMGPLYVRTSK